MSERSLVAWARTTVTVPAFAGAVVWISILTFNDETLTCWLCIDRVRDTRIAPLIHEEELVESCVASRVLGYGWIQRITTSCCLEWIGSNVKELGCRVDRIRAHLSRLHVWVERCAPCVSVIVERIWRRVDVVCIRGVHDHGCAQLLHLRDGHGGLGSSLGLCEDREQDGSENGDNGDDYK